MSKYFKSELLKWKNSYAFYLILVLSLLQLVILPPYFLMANNPVILKNIVFLDMLGYCIVMAIVSILLHDQEMSANHFQNIRSERHKFAIWSMKLLSTDLLLLVPNLLLWLIIGIEVNHLAYYVFIGIVTWLLLVMLNHFHMFLSLFMGKGGNLLISFIECLFIVFATNKAFLHIFWMPIALPVNAILVYGNGEAILMIIMLIGDIALFYIGNLVMISRIKL